VPEKKNLKIGQYLRHTNVPWLWNRVTSVTYSCYVTFVTCSWGEVVLGCSVPTVWRQRRLCGDATLKVIQSATRVASTSNFTMYVSYTSHLLPTSYRYSLNVPCSDCMANAFIYWLFLNSILFVYVSFLSLTQSLPFCRSYYLCKSTCYCHYQWRF